MNGLVVGRRRIGVIHLHRDDRCPQLWDIYSLFLFSLRQTHKRKICCQQQIGKILQQLAGLRLSGLFHLPLSFSPETNVKVTAMAMSPVCGFARDNLSQRFGRDIGAPWRLQQEIHVMGQEEVYFWFYLAHINMYYMSCSCHLQMILSKIMYLRIITFVSKRELLQKKPSSETWKKRG